MRVKSGHIGQKALLWRLRGGESNARAKPVEVAREATGDYSVFTLIVGDEGIHWRAMALIPGLPNGIGILCCHARGNRYDLGTRELREGRSAMPKPLAADFVCLGMTVLSVKLPRLGGRQDESTEDALTKSAQWRGDTLMGQMMKNLVLGVD